MNNRLFRLPVLVFLLSFLSLQLSSCKDKNRDAEIQTAISNKTATEENLAGVSATVSQGVVTLTGTCEDEDCRKLAERSIGNIEGVKKVVNNIQIARIEITPDNQLQASVKEVLEDYDDVQATVSGGVITLRGKADRDKLQQLMMDLNALRPKRIDNQLVLN